MAEVQPITFTRGVPPAEALPGEVLVDCAARALRDDPTVLLQYGPSLGYLPLRKWLAEWRGVSPDQILVSNGSLQIMGFLCRALLKPGDTVLVESPSYDRAITIYRSSGANVVGIPLENDGLSVEALESALAAAKPKLLYVIPDFQNPAGTTMSGAKRRRIAELAVEHGFLVVEDVPYRHLRYAGTEEPTIQSLAPERVLQLSSFSKLLSPGIRTGYVIGPAAIVAAIAKVAEDTYITPTLPTQGMVYEFCRRGLVDPTTAGLLDLYRPRLAATLESLAAELPDADYPRPEGGYFVGVSLAQSIPSAKLLAAAKSAELILTNGDGFFLEAPARTFVRIPFCGVSPDEIREGVSRLARVVRSLA